MFTRTTPSLTTARLLQQTQIPDYAELIVKFLEALVESYLPTAEEERGEEQLRTPTSPYPPSSQCQLSITANLNLSNSMTSLATSQHSPGLCASATVTARTRPPHCMHSIKYLLFHQSFLLLFFFILSVYIVLGPVSLLSP